MAQAILVLATLYFGSGVVVAFAFVLIGFRRATPDVGTMTVGARLLILPGSIVLWPIVLRRWLKPV